MITLKSELSQRPRRHGPWRLLLLLALAVAVGLVAERWRGQWALKRWQGERMAKGETLEATQLWPPSNPEAVEFSNRLNQATRELPERLSHYAGYLSGMILEETGTCRRGSQEPQPPRLPKADTNNTWQELDALLQQSQSQLQSLRELMKDPPSTGGYDVAKILEDNSIPNFIGVRRAAQTLQTVVMNDLHNGDLTAAAEDLGTLLSFVKLYENEPGLVGFMIRVAALGLGNDVCWDALQADGWTEGQLARLQRACQDSSRLLAQMPRTIEAERAARAYLLHWFRQHGYQAWVARYQQIYESFGWKAPGSDTAPTVRNWRQWVFHPLWSFAWADQEELEYSRHVQQDVIALQEAVRVRSWPRLKDQLDAHRESYHPPTAAWRFYTELPIVDRFGDATGKVRLLRRYPYPDFSRAFFTTLKNLTLHEMVIAAISIKRYELRHGKPPVSLAALVPEFLPIPPSDFMDGQPLRYRLNSDGSFTLYSVGHNSLDDGGESLAQSPAGSGQNTSLWDGKDWVWPQVAAGVDATQVSRAPLQLGNE